MQRILITADTVGGVWTYALELIRSMEGQDAEFGLATLGRPLNRSQRQQVRALENVEVFESSYRLEWMEDPWRDVRDSGEWLLQLEGEIRPDLVHLNTYSHASLPWIAPKLLVAHSDVYSWFATVRKSAPPPEWQRYKEEVSGGLRAADLLVAPSRAVVGDLQRHYGVTNRVRVIPNGRSPELFYEGDKEEFIFTVGRLWDEAKNIALLGEIAADLSWPVYAADSTLEPGGRARSAESRGIHLVGELGPRELPGYFARAGIYALPAKYEPFGLSILEAAMSGCALILGDIPSLRENWQHAAIFIRPDEPDALRDAIEYLIQNENQRRDLASKARERSKFYGAKRMGQSYLQEYRLLVRPGPPISQEQYLRRA